MSLQFTKKEIVMTSIFILLYILLGNARSARPNPFISGAVITISIIVPIIAGLIGGKRMGAMVGIFGTAITTITPAGGLLQGVIYELLAIVPNGLAGYLAGRYREQFSTIIVSGGAVAAGLSTHTFLLLVFLQLSVSTVINSSFIIGMLLEWGINSIIAILFYYIYRLGFAHAIND